jgi:hypothetical protein
VNPYTKRIGAEGRVAILERFLRSEPFSLPVVSLNRPSWPHFRVVNSSGFIVRLTAQLAAARRRLQELEAAQRP